MNVSLYCCKFAYTQVRAIHGCIDIQRDNNLNFPVFNTGF